jgi:hypothetical protein
MCLKKRENNKNEHRKAGKTSGFEIGTSQLGTRNLPAH